MSKKVFAVVGGYLTSTDPLDPQPQYIGPYALARLYGLTDRAYECIFASGEKELESLLRGVHHDKLIYLHPRQDGNYILPPEEPCPP